MTILAIDTCETYCSAAIVTSEGRAFSAVDNIGRGHAEHLIPQIEALLEKAGLTYQDIKRIAVTTGPGTFTGLRIGLSVARGIALAQQIPCVGLTSLVVLGAQAYDETDRPAYSIVKGRGGQVFLQGFVGKKDNGLPQELSAPLNIDTDVALSYINENIGVCAGSGAALLPVESAIDYIDPVVLARLSLALDPADYPPEPTYYRPADAIKAKRIIPIGDMP